MKLKRSNKKQSKINAVIYIIITLAFLWSYLKLQEDIVAIGLIILAIVSFYWIYRAWG